MGRSPKWRGRRSLTSETTSSSAARGSARSIRNRSRVSPSACANAGASPWRTAWAPRTIMLPAAWRKMCVSSATGTGLASTSSANGLPAPTGASWSASPTSTTWVRAADRAQQRDEQLEVRHRRLVDDQQVLAELVHRRPLAGIQPSAEWIVDASHAGRLRHPPRGAAGRGDERDRPLLRRRRGADQPDRRGLAGARPAGDDREARAERGAHRGRLLGRRHEVAVGARGGPA